MVYDLTEKLIRQERARKAGLIKQACKEISACHCPEKRALAMVELRRMQMLAGGVA